jgi:hypothetical protein
LEERVSETCAPICCSSLVASEAKIWTSDLAGDLPAVRVRFFWEKRMKCKRGVSGGESSLISMASRTNIGM